MKATILITSFLLCFLHLTSGARILFFFGLSTYSHRIAVWPLVEQLANRGHQITFAQPFKSRAGSLQANITEFYPEELIYSDSQAFNDLDFLNIRLKGGIASVSELAKGLPAKGLSTCRGFLKAEETKKWVKASKFDLVIIDGLMNECGFALAYTFRAKTILFGTTHPFAWMNEAMGIDQQTSWIPELHNAYQYPMSLWGRIRSTLWPLQMYYAKVWSYYPELDKVFREEFQDDSIPPVAELEKKTSLVLQNSHFSEELARSLPPLVVPIAGMYCADSNQKLPKELEDFINGSGKEGFMYVSFGSAANIANAPKEFQKIFHDVMRESKLRFVWKYDGERPAELSDNVYTAKWMPQQAILAHPKIKAFVTHAGLLGTHEAVWNAVPLIAVPVFAEQDFNALRIHRTQRGIMLDINFLTKEKFENAIEKITKDPKYKLNMQKTQKLFKDRPDTPVNTAVWWTEYVLRNDEDTLAALKPLSIHQTWYERRLLDAWGAIFGALGISVWLVHFIISKIFRLFCGKSGSKNSEKKSKKNN